MIPERGCLLIDSPLRLPGLARLDDLMHSIHRSRTVHAVPVYCGMRAKCIASTYFYIIRFARTDRRHQITAIRTPCFRTFTIKYHSFSFLKGQIKNRYSFFRNWLSKRWDTKFIFESQLFIDKG